MQVGVDCPYREVELTFKQCLDCAKSQQKRCPFIYPVLAACFGSKDLKRTGIHVSDLTSCLRKAYYSKRLDWYQAPGSLITLLMGTTIHSTMEEYAPPGALVELELEAKTKKGVIVKGRIDLYESGPQTLTDWKTTRWMYLNKLPYGNHGTQLNIYAWLLRENGYPVKKMQVQYIDLSGPSKCKKCKGPLRPQKGGDYECTRCGKMYAGDKVHPGVALIPIDHIDMTSFIDEKSSQLQWALDQEIAPEKVDKKGNWICGYCEFTKECMAEEMRF